MQTPQQIVAEAEARDRMKTQKESAHLRMISGVLETGDWFTRLKAHLAAGWSIVDFEFTPEELAASGRIDAYLDAKT